MNKALVLILSITYVLPLFSQEFCTTDALNPIETFNAADQPKTVVIDGRAWSTPWGYEKAVNAQRPYPLVVFGPHGKASEYFTTEIRKRYPSFYLLYKERSETAGEALADLIDLGIKQHQFRIDQQRIYYTGWSAGGSGAFKLVRGFLRKGKCFAAINRIAGQSESVLAEAAIPQTSIWMHIGLHDKPIRVQVSRDVYTHLKNHSFYASANETTVKDTVGHDGKEVVRHTKILTKQGQDLVRYTEYPTQGHEAFAGYSDPYFYKWFFTQKWDTDHCQTKTAATITIPLPNLPGGAKPLEMKLMQPGTYIMGSPITEKSRLSREWLPHEVFLSQAFYIGTYEVTQAQWYTVMGNLPNGLEGKGDNYPIHRVTWNDCDRFIKRLNELNLGVFSMPTEAQWEYACRAGTRTRFWFGDALECNDVQAYNPVYDRYMWWGGNNNKQGYAWGCKPVGLKAPNPWGLYDVHGNVWEWCSDWWHMPTSTAASTDPEGPATGSRRVMRGGSWSAYGLHQRSSDRSGQLPNDDQYISLIGLRLVRSCP